MNLISHSSTLGCVLLLLIGLGAYGCGADSGNPPDPQDKSLTPEQKTALLALEQSKEHQALLKAKEDHPGVAPNPQAAKALKDLDQQIAEQRLAIAVLEKQIADKKAELEGKKPSDPDSPAKSP